MSLPQIMALNYPSCYQCVICNSHLSARVVYYRHNKIVARDVVTAMFFNDPAQSNYATMNAHEIDAVEVKDLFCSNDHIRYDVVPPTENYDQ